MKNVDIIHTALFTRRKIRFQYFDYGADEDGDRLYYRGEKDSGYFTVNPRKLRVKDGRYTLEHYIIDQKKFPDGERYYEPITFDVSRMMDIQLINESIEKTDMSFYDNFAKDWGYWDKETLTIRFRNDSMNTVRRLYGNNLFITPVDDFHFKTVMTVREPYSFLLKLLQHGCEAKVLAPEGAVTVMKEIFERFMDLYNYDREPLEILSNAELNRV